MQFEASSTRLSDEDEATDGTDNPCDSNQLIGRPPAIFLNAEDGERREGVSKINTKIEDRVGSRPHRWVEIVSDD